MWVREKHKESTNTSIPIITFATTEKHLSLPLCLCLSFTFLSHHHHYIASCVLFSVLKKLVRWIIFQCCCWSHRTRTIITITASSSFASCLSQYPFRSHSAAYSMQCMCTHLLLKWSAALGLLLLLLPLSLPLFIMPLKTRLMIMTSRSMRDWETQPF